MVQLVSCSSFKDAWWWLWGLSLWFWLGKHLRLALFSSFHRGRANCIDILFIVIPLSFDWVRFSLLSYSYTLMRDWRSALTKLWLLVTLSFLLLCGCKSLCCLLCFYELIDIRKVNLALATWTGFKACCPVLFSTPCNKLFLCLWAAQFTFSYVFKRRRILASLSKFLARAIILVDFNYRRCWFYHSFLLCAFLGGFIWTFLSLRWLINLLISFLLNFCSILVYLLSCVHFLRFPLYFFGWQ